MASSSGTATTSSASSRRTVSSSYDVFINFRGADTRTNFVTLLHKALESKGIHAFLDSKELWEGEEIKPALLKAIRRSRISVPVFSKNYAKSKYCLLELAEIWKCCSSDGQTVLPIFMGVEPHEVRHQIKRFQRPFQKHQRRCESSIVESWKNALTEVGNLKGWTLKGNATIEEQLNIIELIVQRTVRELGSKPLDEEKHLIGIDFHVKELLHLLYFGSDDIQFVGICGMGGLGKTTIAKVVYNRIFRSFNGSSFLTDIREEASQGNKGLVSLQKQLLHDIFKSDYDISIVSTGSKLIAERLHRETILLILDDVNDYEQLDALIGGLNWFGPGSKVIVTTRDKHILNVHEKKIGKDIQIYMPEELDPRNSLLLFSLHAFLKKEPPEHYKQLSHEMVRYTGGLPLSLEVLGSFLMDKDKKEWRDTLEILKDIGNDNIFAQSIKEYDDRVFKKLMISYNQLGNCEKTIFLDVACYFNGWEKEEAISLWEACDMHPRLTIKELIQKHLLKIDVNFRGYECLKMHDQLQYMGRKIIMEDSNGDATKRSRLWSQDEIWKVLKKDMETQMVEGMLIHNLQVKVGDEFEVGTVLSCEAFQKMPCLRFLEFCGISSLNGEFTHLPSKLRWMRWRGLTILPPDFYHPELVHLDLSCEFLRQSWNDPTQNKKKRFRKLKVLNLRDYMEVSLSPNFFLWFPCLQRLNLYKCDELLELPDCICRLASLKTITISGCRSFRKLPTSIGDLRHLVELCLRDTDIEELPDGVGMLEKLEKLVVIEGKTYARPVKLPASMGRMKSLHHVNLTNFLIEKLPDDFSKLLSLEVFKMDIPSWPRRYEWISCKSLPELPSTLTHLQLKDCISLQRISIQSHLERLEELSLRHCKSLVELPDLSNLRRLRKLDISHCEFLKKIPSLEGTESLEELIAKGCYTLRELPDLSKLKRLRELDISNCQNLEEIPSLEGTECLEELNAWNCHKLRELPDLSNLKRLRKLIIYCENLEEIPSLEGTESLEEFNGSGCYKLRELPDLSKLKRLRELDISYCENLEEIPSLEGTKSLAKLNARNCHNLRELLDLSNLKRLRKLDISYCENLEEIPSLGGTESLEKLNARNCHNLREILDLSNLKRLRILDIACCKNLEEIPSLEGTESLEVLYAWNCHRLRELPDLSNLKRLRILDISYCENLEEIPSLRGTESLEELNAKNCHKLRELLDLSNLKRLRKLDIRFCKNLKEIPSLEGTESLEELDAWNCHKLRELPDLSKLKRLRILDISYCENLEEISCLEGTESLEVLYAWNCHKLRELPDLSKLKRLRKLSIGFCKNLEEIHGLPGSLEKGDLSNLESCRKFDIGCDENLEKIHGLEGTRSLEELDASSCYKLKELPDLSKLKRLRKLVISCCENLKEIPSLKGTESLEELVASGCHKLRELPDLSKVKRLRKLNISCCDNLEEIRGLDGRKFLTELDGRSCFKITETKRKILGQGTLRYNFGEVQGSFSVAADEIYNCSPILCVVFAFTPSRSFPPEETLGFELVTITLDIEASIRRGESLTWCMHSIRIEDIEVTYDRDLIYIHHLKGFDWFGFPLESKDAINKLNVKLRPESLYSDPTVVDTNIPSFFHVKFWKVLFENKESGQQMPSQQSSAKLVAEFFRWSDVENAEEGEENGALRTSNYEGGCLDEEDDEDDEDVQQRLYQPSHVKEKRKISPSEDIEEAKEETYPSEDAEEEEEETHPSGDTEEAEEEASPSEDIEEEEEERSNATIDLVSCVGFNSVFEEENEEEEKMTPSKRSHFHYDNDEEMLIQQPNIDGEVQGIPSDIEEAEKRNRTTNLFSSLYGGVGGSNNVPKEVVEEEEDETKVDMQFLCRPMKVVWDCFCKCFTPGFLR